METSLHRTLKELYADHPSQCEVTIDGFRADVLRENEIVEVQASSLGAISKKIQRLSLRRRILIVKPVAFRTQVVRIKPRSHEVLSKRFSPRRGHLSDLFDELIHFTKAFPHNNVTLEVLTINQEEHRVESRSRKRFTVIDKKLIEIVQSVRLRTANDLVKLLPGPIPARFTTKILADVFDMPEWKTQKVAYTMRHCGASHLVGKEGNRLVYQLGRAA